jgi:hypothetical protein
MLTRGLELAEDNLAEAELLLLRSRVYIQQGDLRIQTKNNQSCNQWKLFELPKRKHWLMLIDNWQ